MTGDMCHETEFSLPFDGLFKEQETDTARDCFLLPMFAQVASESCRFHAVFRADVWKQRKHREVGESGRRRTWAVEKNRGKVS